MSIKSNKFINKLDSYKVTPQEPWLIESKTDFLKLDWNEGTIPPEFVKEKISKIIKDNKYLAWYPDYNSKKLNSYIAKKLNISELNILTFPGSDVALETICRTFINPKDDSYILLPSYSNFITFAQSCGANMEMINLKKPFDFEYDFLANSIKSKNPKILYLVSPNNPCGYAINKDDIKKICKKFFNCLIILDQAYVEFFPENDMSYLIKDFDNLIITRTFSKAYSLAGLRIGYMIGNKNLLKEIKKIRNGKNISMISQKIAIECLKEEKWLKKRVQEVSEGKLNLYEIFKNLNFKFYKSNGNFILFEPDNPHNLLDKLKSRGVFIRDQIKATKGGLRVTISDKASNEKFIEILSEVCIN